MGRLELTLALCALFFVVFCLGYALAWLISRLHRVTPEDLARYQDIVDALEQAKQDREADKNLFREREADLMRRLNAAEVDAQATMEALQNARLHIERLQNGQDGYVREQQ